MKNKIIKMESIFYVDDDENNGLMFKDIFFERWDVTSFSNPSEALKELKLNSPVIIISDYQMQPHMNGIDFLKEAQKLQPNAVRIIFTGSTEEYIFVEALKSGLIFDYWKKPDDASDLKSKLENAHKHYQEQIIKSKLP